MITQEKAEQMNTEINNFVDTLLQDNTNFDNLCNKDYIKTLEKLYKEKHLTNFKLYDLNIIDSNTVDIELEHGFLTLHRELQDEGISGNNYVFKLINDILLSDSVEVIDSDSIGLNLTLYHNKHKGFVVLD